MALTATATRMMDTLPSYYWGEPLIERIVQAWANEIDRIDARLDQIKNGLVPSLADDTLKMLAIWEALLGLPVQPAGATVSQRRGKVEAALRNSRTAADYLSTLTAAIGDSGWVLLRDTPDPLEDTLVIPFVAGSYSAGQVEELVYRRHPAHRQLHMRYAEGFLLDVARLDGESL